MLSSCVVALVLSALAQGMPSEPQPDGVYVAQESTYEMGMTPALHQPDNMAGVPDSELKSQASPPGKQKMFKRRKSNNIDFPSPAQLFPFRPVANDQPTHELGQQTADVESPMFVQQPGGPNGPSSFPSDVSRPRVQFPSPSQLKPFHFGGEHNMRMQHLSAGNAFVGQDAPQPQLDQNMDMPEAPMIFPFHFAPRDNTEPMQQQQQQPWMASNPPQPQQYDDQPDIPHWAMQAPPPLHRFPPMGYGDYVAPPMYDDERPPFGNTIEDGPTQMDQVPSYEYDEAPMPPFRPPFRPPFPRLHAPWGRWNRHSRSNWW